FLGSVREELDVSSKLCELAICLVAIINRADYEYMHHLPILIAAGASDLQVAALPSLINSGADVSMFNERERAVIALTREMSINVAPTEETFAEVKKALPDPQHVIEIVGVISTYNMVSRFLVTLGVEPE
ncbi:MAG TPA: carboxymuconolactone decarboxylase family protein, partial [Gammaproteobacteria bacterium]|nr:carboxymuconolactone decarboxylase family protein [Gammaproteobacteria bacterium]